MPSFELRILPQPDAEMTVSTFLQGITAVDAWQSPGSHAILPGGSGCGCVDTQLLPAGLLQMRLCRPGASVGHDPRRITHDCRVSLWALSL